MQPTTRTIVVTSAALAGWRIAAEVCTLCCCSLLGCRVWMRRSERSAATRCKPLGLAPGAGEVPGAAGHASAGDGQPEEPEICGGGDALEDGGGGAGAGGGGDGAGRGGGGARGGRKRGLTRGGGGAGEAEMQGLEAGGAVRGGLALARGLRGCSATSAGGGATESARGSAWRRQRRSNRTCARCAGQTASQAWWRVCRRLPGDGGRLVRRGRRRR